MAKFRITVEPLEGTESKVDTYECSGYALIADHSEEKTMDAGIEGMSLLTLSMAIKQCKPFREAALMATNPGGFVGELFGKMKQGEDLGDPFATDDEDDEDDEGENE